MLKREQLLEISKNLTTNPNDFTAAFRQNLFKYIESDDITLADISNASGIPYATLNSFLYGKSQNVRIDNVVKLAKTFGVSIDELVGADTLQVLTKESLAMCRNLPENDLYLVRWFIRYLTQLNSKIEPNKRYVSVMMPLMDNNGDFKVTSDYEKVEITNLEEPFRSKIFMGFHIICDHYMPYYAPGNIILIANDRPPKPTEHAVVRVGKYLFIIRRVIEDGIAKYYSVRDDKYRIDEAEVDELIGYIAHTIS